jgi:hypothetical protein
VAWGVIYPDFLRVFGIPSRYSRGQVLEENWEAIDKSRNPENELGKQNLADWSGQTWRPAFIFNTTIVETGERMMISTSGFESEKSKTFQQMMNGNGDQKNYSMRISTAARLSSSFPFVTPTARSNSDCSSLDGGCLHIADGGYYDNYGVSSLAEWLNEALEKNPEDGIKDILIIQIRSSFVSQKKEPKAAKDLFLQTYSPAITLLNIRTAAQYANAEEIISLLGKRWNNSGKGYHLETAVFELQLEKDPPLSWHLTKEEKKDIDEGWKTIINNDKNKGLEIFKNFLNSMK